MKLILIFALFFSVNVYASDILFIGHAYGRHGVNAIPYEPLKLFFEKKHRSNHVRIWGGDLTQDPARFPEFKSYIDTLGGVNLLIRGNHDGNLYAKTPFWTDYVTNHNIWIHNFDLDPDMKFNILPVKPTIIASHYVWFNQLFSPLNMPNSMYGARPIEINNLKFNDERPHLFIAGDCGAFTAHSAGFARTFIGHNQFVCSGIGGGLGIDNIVVIDKENNTKPIFFNSVGDVIPHICRYVSSNSGFGNEIEVCSGPDHMKLKGFK